MHASDLSQYTRIKNHFNDEFKRGREAAFLSVAGGVTYTSGEGGVEVKFLVHASDICFWLRITVEPIYCRQNVFVCDVKGGMTEKQTHGMPTPKRGSIWS